MIPQKRQSSNSSVLLLIPERVIGLGAPTKSESSDSTVLLLIPELLLLLTPSLGMVSIYNLTAISVYRWVVFKEKVLINFFLITLNLFCSDQAKQ